MKVQIHYIRSLRGGLNEHVLYEELEFGSKAQALKHARETKKRIAGECHYRFPRDIVNYIILGLGGKQ